MTHIKVGLDIDGILANYVESYSRRLIQTSGKNLFEGEGEIIWTDWNMDYVVGYTQEERLRAKRSIEEDEFFWLKLSPYKGIEYLRELGGLSDNLYFITDRSGGTAKVQTELWLQRYGIVNPTVLISKFKGQAASALKLDYYIDDNVGNCEDVITTGTKVYLMDQPWNVIIPAATGVQRVYTLEGFLEEVERGTR